METLEREITPTPEITVEQGNRRPGRVWLCSEPCGSCRKAQPCFAKTADAEPACETAQISVSEPCVFVICGQEED